MTKQYVLVEIDPFDVPLPIEDPAAFVHAILRMGDDRAHWRTAHVSDVFCADTRGRTDRVWYEADPSDYVVLSDQGISPR